MLQVIEVAWKKKLPMAEALGLPPSLFTKQTDWAKQVERHRIDSDRVPELQVSGCAIRRLGRVLASHAGAS